jgi:hypothetical protein
MKSMTKLALAIGIAALTFALGALGQAKPAGACIVSACENHVIFYCCGSTCGHRSC